MRRFFHLLGFRLFLGIAVIVAAGTTLFTMFLVDWQSSKYISAAQQSAANISDLISRSTRYSMLLNRREDIYEIMLKFKFNLLKATRHFVHKCNN